MKLVILSLFPDALQSYFNKGIIQKAQSRGLFDIQFIDLREFSQGVHRQVDDYPFGGKKGMVLKADVLYRAITSIEHYDNYRLIYTCPKGPVLTQQHVREFSQSDGLVIITGYYEGVDDRIFNVLPIEKVSIGNFVLSSGELPALTIAEATIRMIPGVLGNPDSLEDDSILTGVLEAPQYTQPREFMGHSVPDVVTSGHHDNIRRWRRRESLKETLFNRPDLLKMVPVTNEDQELIEGILKEETDV